MANLKGAGRPRIWDTGEKFLNSVEAYAENCEYEGKFMNVAGFCRYAKIHRDTFYEYGKFYPQHFAMANDIIEDMVLNNDKTTMSIFYLKNKFGYRDKVETVNTNTNKNIDMSHLSTEDIKALLNKEDEN